PIHAVVVAGQQIPVVKAEIVGHRPNLRPPRCTHPRGAEIARRATTSGRSPGSGVATSPRKRYERPAGLFATGVRYAPFPRSPSPFRLPVGSLPGGRAGSGMPDRSGESGDRYAGRVGGGAPGGPVAAGRA